MNEKNRTKIIQLSLTAVFFLTPLLFFSSTHDQFELPKITFIGITVLPALFLLLFTKKPISGDLLSLFLLLFILTQAIACLPNVSLSWTTSLFGDYENFAGLYTLLTYFVWYWVFIQVLDRSVIQRVLYFVVLTAFLSSLYAIGQHFQFDFQQWNPESVNATREFAALGNPNFLSAYIAMAIPFFLFLSFGKEIPETTSRASSVTAKGFLLGIGALLLFLGTIKGQVLLGMTPSTGFGFIVRILGLFCFSLFYIRVTQPQSFLFRSVVGLVLLLGLYSTASRGGFLAAFLGTVIWLLLTLQRPVFKDKIKQSWAQLPRLPLLTFLLALVLFSLTFGGSFLQRLSDSLLHIPQSLTLSRLHIWKPAFEMIKANPLLGLGLDTFKIAFPHYSGIEFNQIDGLFTSSRMAHNEFLQITATSGLLGLIAYLALLFVFLWSWKKAYRNASLEKQQLLIALLASAAAYQIQNLFSFGVAALNLIWFFILASTVFTKRDPLSEKNLAPSFLMNFTLKTVLILVIGTILFFPIRHLAADIAFAKGDDYSSVIKNRNAQTTSEALDYYSSNEIHYLERSVALFPWDVKYTLYSGLAYEQRARAIPVRSDEEFLKALGYYQKAVLMSPANAYYYSDEGRVYSALAAKDPRYWAQAEEADGKAAYWAPASPYFLLNWVLTLERTGKPLEAKEEMDQAFASDTNFSAKVLSQMAFDEYRSGEKKTAFDHIAECVRRAPNNPEAYYCRGILYFSEKRKKEALADFEKVESLHPDPYKNSSIQGLDQLIAECQK